jgi:hypothetical protein
MNIPKYLAVLFMNESLEWRTEKRKVSDLKEFPHNPRQITETQFFKLKNSFDEFNYVELIAIDKDNTILAGHMRLKALIAQGRLNEEIEVRVPNRRLSKTEREKYVIISNHVTGEDDFDILADYWDTDLLLECGMTEKQLGFTPIEKILEEEKEEPDTVEPEKCKTCGQKIKKK